MFLTANRREGARILSEIGSGVWERACSRSGSPRREQARSHIGQTQLSFFLKNSMVRVQESSAAVWSKRGVVSLWKP